MRRLKVTAPWDPHRAWQRVLFLLGKAMTWHWILQGLAASMRARGRRARRLVRHRTELLVLPQGNRWPSLRRCNQGYCSLDRHPREPSNKYHSAPHIQSAPLYLRRRPLEKRQRRVRRQQRQQPRQRVMRSFERLCSAELSRKSRREERVHFILRYKAKPVLLGLSNKIDKPRCRIDNP